MSATKNERKYYELKLAASGLMYSASGDVGCEWKMNLLGEKKRLQ